MCTTRSPLHADEWWVTVRFEVFTVLAMKLPILSDVTPCGCPVVLHRMEEFKLSPLLWSIWLFSFISFGDPWICSAYSWDKWILVFRVCLNIFWVGLLHWGIVTLYELVHDRIHWLAFVVPVVKWFIVASTGWHLWCQWWSGSWLHPLVGISGANDELVHCGSHWLTFVVPVMNWFIVGFASEHLIYACFRHI
jgi:hypothetical protein